ncbi:hypothetical protein [Micromonospora coerulea]|uniref:hypothetical protein n=1 Tax=Micromonospora coerulea TaxID=47856 RepID=UPI001903CC60|nr:hypothetical protein [Micromonospora veneta]
MNRRDEDEFREFVAARLDPLRRTAYLLCRDWHTADDLVSITVGRHWRRVRAADNIDAYARGGADPCLAGRVPAAVAAGTELRRAARPANLGAGEPPLADRELLWDLLGRLAPGRRAVVVQQIIDEAIGAPPPTWLDVDQIIGREARRARRRRVGAYGMSAVAVLAVALGGGLVVTGGPTATGPVIAGSPGASVAGQTAEAQVRNAMLAALDRAAPGLQWLPGAEQENDMAKWSGPAVAEPSWPVNQFSHLSASGWIGHGVAVRGDVRARLSIESSRSKAGQPTEPMDCRGPERACETSLGPDGERIRVMELEARYSPPGQPIIRPGQRTVDVLRPDGTRVRVDSLSRSAEFLLTAAEMTAIALDPALSLP